MVFLISNGGGVYCETGLLEVIWKITASIINDKLKELFVFHDDLHGLRDRRGVYTEIIYSIILQQMLVIKNYRLFHIYPGLSKPYNVLNLGRCKDIMREYMVGTEVTILLLMYWEINNIFSTEGGYHCNIFLVTRGETHLYPIYTIVFNIMLGGIFIH